MILKILSLATLVAIYILTIAACVNYSSPGSIKDFTLADYDGNRHSLSDCKDSKPSL